MLKNLMEDKRLDFNAPLLSVRRFSAAAASPSTSKAEESGRTGGKPSSRRSSLPFYKSDLKSGPVRNAGLIPFVWEQTPGQPKDGPGSGSILGGPHAKPLVRPPIAPKFPPGRTLNDKEFDGSSAASRDNSDLIRGPISPSSNVSLVKPSEDSEGGARKVREKEKEEPIPEECCEDDDAFSDALDTLSRADSCFMNCSVSGLSSGRDAVEPTGIFSVDPQVRDFMMGRFLPAAQAMASGSPQCTSRKPPNSVRKPAKKAERDDDGDRRRPLPLPYQHRPNYVSQYAGEKEEGESFDDDDDVGVDYDDSGHFSSKACGLLPRFCLKSSFCLLNPVPGMKVRGSLPPPPGRRLSPQIRTTQNGYLGRVEDEHSWEAVYKHKLGRGNQPQGEDGSKLTSESNQLTNWSDSLTPDGSSPYRHSPGGGGISPYRKDASQSPFHEGKGFLGVPKGERRSCKVDDFESCEKDGDNYWEITPHHGSQQGSGSMSPAIEKTLYVDSVCMPESPQAKSSSVDTNLDTKGMMNSADKDSEVAVESQRMEESLVLETCKAEALQPKASEVVEPGLQSCSERSNHGDMDSNKGFRPKGSSDGPLPFKAEDPVKNDASLLQSLLPPPLPKSPSESWLWRTLPSVSSKNPSPQSFLGIQFQPRKQTFQPSSIDKKRETNVKPSKVHHRQLRFAEVLTKPVSPQSEP